MVSEQKVNPLKLLKRDTVDMVADKIKEFQNSGDLHFPAAYSPENALKSAWLLLQDVKTGKKDGYKPALEVCTKDSIANSLLDMVVQGLNPAKKQGYFLVYGKKLVFQRSYFGTMAVTKRVTGAKSIDAQVIYKGDQVSYEMVNGRIVNLTHKQDFINIDKEEILGAYCTIVEADGSVYNEVMTMKEIRQAWSKSQSWNDGQEKEQKGSVHEEFTQEMAKKTVINRACKKFMNSSDDESIVIKHIQGMEEDEDLELQQELEEKANGDIIDIEVEPEAPKEPEVTPMKEKPSAYDTIDAEFTEVEGPGFD